MTDALSPTPHADINAALNDFRVRIQTLLSGRFTGMYLVGSLALGDFDPHHSDIDFVVVTDTHLGDDLFEGLKGIHAQFATGHSPWAHKIEAVYAPVTTLGPPAQNVPECPQIEKGTDLFKAPLEDGWVFQCVTLRDHGVVVAGPDPRTLVAPVPTQSLSDAAAKIAGMWLTQAKTDPTWLPWLRQRDAQAFVVLTLCRLLYSLATGSVASKPGAAQWALQQLEGRWGQLIARALANRHQAGRITQSEEDETLAFIRFVHSQPFSL